MLGARQCHLCSEEAIKMQQTTLKRHQWSIISKCYHMGHQYLLFVLDLLLSGMGQKFSANSRVPALNSDEQRNIAILSSMGTAIVNGLISIEETASSNWVLTPSTAIRVSLVDARRSICTEGKMPLGRWQMMWIGSSSLACKDEMGWIKRNTRVRPV